MYNFFCFLYYFLFWNLHLLTELLSCLYRNPMSTKAFRSAQRSLKWWSWVSSLSFISELFLFILVKAYYLKMFSIKWSLNFKKCVVTSCLQKFFRNIFSIIKVMEKLMCEVRLKCKRILIGEFHKVSNLFC